MSYDRQTDILIVGGGIVGTAIARELSRYDIRVMLCEKSLDVATGTTKANSGILHSGVDAAPGTLKAALNVKGLALYRSIYEDLGLDIKFTGSLIVAGDQQDIPVLEQLVERGRHNGVAGDIRILGRRELFDREPGLSRKATAALWTSATGIVCPYGAAIALAKNAARNGAAIVTGCEVQQILTEKGRVCGAQTSAGIIRCRYVINAAGIQAAMLSRSCGDDSFSITPRKGEYLLFDKSIGEIVKTVVFPTPGKISKGILVAPTTHGNYFVGPNAEDAVGQDDRATTRTGLNEILAGARKLVPSLPAQGITQFAGLRAVSDTGDFIIRSSSAVQGLWHAAGIQSPGLTAAPAIAEHIVELMKDQGLALAAKRGFQPVEPRLPRLRELSCTELDELIADSPLYGRVICRCEQVSEGEIVAAIHDLCGARTIDAVKRRTRAGMGRCQGGFCSPKVAAILARELGVTVSDIRKDDFASRLFFDKYTNAEVQEYV